tara:strand:+ start:816 stop:1610 length:795 start_codon:yes stop_codon:yes gene_type:complete
MSPPLILLPPSEGKSSGGNTPTWSKSEQSFPELESARKKVIKALKTAMKLAVEDRSKLLGVGESKTNEATKTNLLVDKGMTLPAIERYTGVLYDALEYGTLSTKLKKRVDSQVVIFSGLWGILRPEDLIPDYKLKMGAELPILGKPSHFWKPLISSSLAKSAAGVVWDLLPKEHSAAWDPSISSEKIRVNFLDDVVKNKKRTLITVSHWNKLLKGSLVRFLAESQIDEPSGLRSFKHPQGYIYKPDMTIQNGKNTEIFLVTQRK